MRRIFSWIACAVVLAVPAHSDTIGEEKRFKINKINGTDFEVIALRGMGAPEFWCAAGSYAVRRQNLPGGTEIYLKRGKSRSVTAQNAQSVVFSFSPKGLTPSKSSVWTISQIGATFRSSQGLRQCRDAFTRSTK